MQIKGKEVHVQEKEREKTRDLKLVKDCRIGGKPFEGGLKKQKKH